MKRPPFYKSVYYAFKGLFWMLKTERNFQLEVLALVINLFLIVYFQLNSIDAVLIFLTYKQKGRRKWRPLELNCYALSILLLYKMQVFYSTKVLFSFP